MKHFTKAIILAAITFCGFSTVAFSGTVSIGRTELNPFGHHERSGFIRFSIDENDFATASPTSPIYIRIMLRDGAILSQTRVWDHQENLDAATRDPIYLALSLTTTTPQPGIQVTAPADSLAIVRWKEGEDQIWLRVACSSNDWLTGGSLSNDAKVSFALGHSVKKALLGTQKFQQNHANLIGNTHSESFELVDTRLHLNLIGATLPPSFSDPDLKADLWIQLTSYEAGYANHSESPEGAIAASAIISGTPTTHFNSRMILANAWLPPRTRELYRRAPDWQTGTVTLLDMVDFLNQEFPYDACEFNLIP